MCLVGLLRFRIFFTNSDLAFCNTWFGSVVWGSECRKFCRKICEIWF
jgi:hypothetical protein